MQNKLTINNIYTNHLQQISLPKNENDIIRTMQIRRGEDPCYRTNKRLSCEAYSCELRIDCRKLVAAWKR